MQLSKNLNPYWVFFSLFFKFASNFKHFQKKKITLITSVLRKLQTVKEMVREIFK